MEFGVHGAEGFVETGYVSKEACEARIKAGVASGEFEEGEFEPAEVCEQHSEQPKEGCEECEAEESEEETEE